MGHSVVRPDRRARLKLVVCKKTETEIIERILRDRLRERRERRIAKARREAQYAKDAAWVGPREIAGKSNPHDLETALKSGTRRRLIATFGAITWLRKGVTR